MTSRILPIDDNDREWVRSVMVRDWGDELVLVHLESYHPHLLPGFKAVEDGEPTGLITYQIKGRDCEIITLNSYRPREGIGDGLIKAVEKAALAKGCRTCSLVTTNNNLNALGFYQKRGYCIIKVHPGAVDESRKLKPSIPVVDEDGIPIRDEITLRKQLG